MQYQQDLLSPEDLAMRWGTTRGSLAQMRYLGRGPLFIKINAKTVRYRLMDVLDYETAQTRQQTGEVKASA